MHKELTHAEMVARMRALLEQAHASGELRSPKVRWEKADGRELVQQAPRR